MLQRCLPADQLAGNVLQTEHAASEQSVHDSYDDPGPQLLRQAMLQACRKLQTVLEQPGRLWLNWYGCYFLHADCQYSLHMHVAHVSISKTLCRV